MMHALASAVLVVTAFGAAPLPKDAACARALLAAAARAYRAAPGLKDTLTYVLEAPRAEREPKTLELRLGAGKDVFFGDAFTQVTAAGKTVYLTRSGAPDAYVEAEWAGDPAAALERLQGGQGSLFVPLQIAMRLSQNPEAWLDALRFRQLSPLRVARCDADRIHFEADNGKLDVQFDRRTHFLASLHLRFRPPDAPSGVWITIDGKQAPEALSSATALVAFDPGARRAVASMADLDAKNLPLGTPAPGFSLATSDGGRVSLQSLRGRVVVLDFWATWCAPCWTGLAELQRFSDKAAAEGLAVTVVLIDTLEEFPNERERADRITELFRARGMTLPAALDEGGRVFEAFGSPGLPSTVVISPQGTTVKYHQGLEPHLAETLETEARAALAHGR